MLYNKQPLAQEPIGQGDGPTAQELGITFLTHQTPQSDVYASMIRSPIGRPLAFVPRQSNTENAGDVPGELALRGNGHYTMRGRDSQWDPNYGDGSPLIVEFPSDKVPTPVEYFSAILGRHQLAEPKR